MKGKGWDIREGRKLLEYARIDGASFIKSHTVYRMEQPDRFEDHFWVSGREIDDDRVQVPTVSVQQCSMTCKPP